MLAGSDEMGKFAETFVKDILPRIKKEKSATVVALRGDLGSGKTTFTKYAARALGVEGTVASPTFIIEKIYKLDGKYGFSHLIHIDAYRLEGGGELAALGFEEALVSPRNLIFIEWPERVEDVLPHDVQTLRFSFIDENTREVEY